MARKNSNVKSAPKLQVYSGNARAPLTITQIRLARVLELQSTLSYTFHQLTREWNALRREVMRGAPVEVGPIRAWIREHHKGRKRLIVK